MLKARTYYGPSGHHSATHQQSTAQGKFFESAQGRPGQPAQAAFFSPSPAQRVRKEDQPVQATAAPGSASPAGQQSAQPPNRTGLPDSLKNGIESLSGISMDNVRVHYNSSRPAQLNAHAYAQGTDIHLAPGQDKHLPHEAWHVVQQVQGRVRPTTQAKGVPINDTTGLEQEADLMGAKSSVTGSTAGTHGLPTSEDAPRGTARLGAGIVQRVNVGFVPANPGNYRNTTNIVGGSTWATAGDKPFNNSQRPRIYANNIQNGGGQAPVLGVGQHPTEDTTGGALVDRNVVTPIEPEIDHIVPRVDGGANAFSNARVLSKQNNMGNPLRPGRQNQRLRIYQTITLSANIPGRIPYPATRINAGSALNDMQAALLAHHAGIIGIAGVAALSGTHVNAISAAQRNTSNNVTVT